MKNRLFDSVNKPKPKPSAAPVDIRATYRDTLKRFPLTMALLASLSGCATMRYSTTYCLSHDQQLPAEPPKVKDKLTGQADKDLTTIAGSAIRLRAWGEGLQTILEGCREPSR